MKVIVTGGGTGGHIYPAIAVAEAIRKLNPRASVHYIGGKTGPEVEIVPAAGIPFTAVESRKLRRVVSVSTLAVLYSLFRGYRQASALIRKLKADAVVGTGGYVAAAAGLAAAHQGIPLIIQACDAAPGRTNLWLGKRARRICVWFDDTKRFFPPGRAVSTGVPLRSGIVSTKTQIEARNELGLRPDLFTLLVIGGSQGARKLNEVMIGALPLLRSSVQIVHQTGPRHIDDVRAAIANQSAPNAVYQARPYLSGEEVPLAYRAADLMVCRCGISTLAEVTANGVPALMIPLPTAYADHQTANALEVEKVGAGEILPEVTLTAAGLAERIDYLAGNSERRFRMSEAGKRLSRPNAAEMIARMAFEISENHEA